MTGVSAYMPPRAQPNAILSRHVTADLSESEPVNEPRRSHRPRRPSARQVESDEYEASQRSGLSESQLELASQTKSKKYKKPGRGNRPGIIVQPTADFGSTSHKRSKAPASAAESNLGDSRMASPAIGNAALNTGSRANAVRSASAILGADASRYSMSTLKQIIASGEAVRQEGGSNLMEVERGIPPTFKQPNGRTGLASRQQSPNRGAPAGSAEGGELQFAGVPEQPRVTLPDNNTDTEPSSDPDPIRPEDSVSQRVPPVRPLDPLRAVSLADPVRKAHTRAHLNGGSPASSNTEPEEETVRSLKRQRTAPPLPVRLPKSRDLQSRPTTSSIPARVPPPRAQLSSSYDPPPTSDLGAVLTWAAGFAKRVAASEHVGGTGRSKPDFDLLATVLDDLRHSPTVTSALRAPTESRHARNVKEDAAVQEAQETLALSKKACGFLLSITSHKRLTLQDFPGFDGHVVTLIIPELIATSIAQGPFGTHDVQMAMATKLFNVRWPREFPDLRVRKPPYPLMSLITHRISWARGQARNRIRPAIPSDYNLINPPRTREDLQHNRDLVNSCLPNAFHCRDLVTDVHPYEHKALSHCIAAAFFWAADSLGMTHHHLYYPMPLPTVATALTKMQHCLSEWKTGRYVPKELNVDKQRRIYEAHLAGLTNVGKDDPDKLRDMQIDWFWYAVDYAGGSVEEEEPVQPVTWANRVSDGESDLGDGIETDADLDADY